MERSAETQAAARIVAGMVQPLGNAERTCEKHGAYEATGRHLTMLKRDIWTACPGCEADRAAAEQAEREQRAADLARADMESKMEQVAVPPRFVGKTLDNFNADTEAQRYALTTARAYLENFAQHA